MPSERGPFDMPVIALAFLSWSVATSLLMTNARNVSSKARGEQRLWAEEGGQAVLPCYLDPQELEDSLREVHRRLSVRWERQGTSSPQVHHMVLQVTPSGLKIRAHSMMSRASVRDQDFLHGNFSLRIEPASSHDVGRYTARVRYGSKVHRCELKLDVVSVTANPLSPLVESESVNLTCNCTLPEKPVKIRWFHTSHHVTASGRFRAADQTLFISRLMGSDCGPWVCELTYAGGKTVSATHHLQVLGFAGPSFPVVYAAAGSDAHLSCELNDNPMDYDSSKIAIHWSHMTGEDLKTKSNLHQENNRTLRLPAVGPGSAGQYLCEVTINSTTISKSITLVVMKVTSSIEGPVLEGSHLLLTCSLSHPPGKVRFQWKWLGPGPANGSEAASRSSERVSSGWIREFSTVSPEDAGIWECSIHSAEGMLGSVQYHLDIAGAQVASPQQTVMPRKITYGLMTFLFVLLVFITVLGLTLLRRRTHSLNFPALDRLVAVAIPRKEVKDKEKVHEEKVPEIEL